jgi:hypothetical protein
MAQIAVAKSLQAKALPTFNWCFMARKNDRTCEWKKANERERDFIVCTPTPCRKLERHCMAQSYSASEQAKTQDCQGCEIITVGFPFAVGALKVLEPYAGKLAQPVPNIGIRFLGGVRYPVWQLTRKKKDMKKRKLLFPIIILFMGFLVYHILFGKLLAFSPLILGFDKYDTEYATIYYHKTDKLLDLKNLDSLITEVKQFHKLNYNKTVRLFICKTDNEFRRYTGSKARFVTIFGNAIFMSGKANNERKTNSININVYLKHELSHLLVYQNMSFFKSINYPQWFLEGLAVYSSNQFGVDGYLTKREASKKIEEGNFVNPKDWGTAFSSKGITVTECKVANKYRFIYSEFGCIVDDLINTFGREKFLKFFKQSLQSDDFYVLFKQTYKKDFSEYLEEFKTKIKATNNV